MVVAAAGFADMQDRDEMGNKDDSKFVAWSPGRIGSENSMYKSSEVGTRLAYYIKDTLWVHPIPISEDIYVPFSLPYDEPFITQSWSSIIFQAELILPLVIQCTE